eukprot:CAMPEP_0168462488 /NCGR_PEP_ID=MMETSP0228-20121227/54546_1 /TAXON_ID=133427 /ORGANISM="Protoceratium reticulatum, Strain CCCM 535 (=CCMP 1889)" /LENGTH=76 /DNA_ID=CAMNT_0008477875 /DNA_START=362 /DNA_END=588 /DNA_ORIENTATION=-
MTAVEQPRQTQTFRVFHGPGVTTLFDLVTAVPCADITVVAHCLKWTFALSHVCPAQGLRAALLEAAVRRHGLCLRP